MTKAIFIAATGQNVGKTTTSLGIFSGLKKRFSKVGFIKPVGQQHVPVGEGLRVDKDAVLFKEHFHLESDYEHMSPVLFPSGFTREYIDDKVSTKELEKKIIASFEKISKTHEFTLVEGTGHMGVGSIVGLSNARVAALIDAEVVIVVPGGIGSAFDQLTLNKALCDSFGAKIRGVILNRVQEEKREMLENYMRRALERWGIPLLGCIPFNKFLSTPSMNDFSNLFQSPMLSGKAFRYRHFLHARLLATSTVDDFMRLTVPNQLIITHASREDIVCATITKHQNFQKENAKDLKGGMILTGNHPPSPEIISKADKIDLPIIYAPVSSFEVMQRITSFIGKIRNEDTLKVEKAITLVESHVEFDKLLQSPSLT